HITLYALHGRHYLRALLSSPTRRSSICTRSSSAHRAACRAGAILRGPPSRPRPVGKNPAVSSEPAWSTRGCERLTLTHKLAHRPCGRARHTQRTTMKASQPLALAAAVALAGASIVGVSTAASAHNFIVSTTPAEGSTLTTLPAQFEVTTNDDLLDVTGNADAFVLDIVDSDGLYYGDGCITV